MVVIKCVDDNKKALSELPDKYLGFHQDLKACVDNFNECVTLMRSNMRRKEHLKNGLTTKDKAYYE